MDYFQQASFLYIQKPLVGKSQTLLHTGNVRKRNTGVLLWLNDKEYADFEMKAIKTGLTKQAYLRKLLKNIQPKENPPIEFFEVLKELRKIGTNLNQVAAKANSTGVVDTVEYWRNVRWLQTVVGDLMEAMY